jgi:hypothetical protein
MRKSLRSRHSNLFEEDSLNNNLARILWPPYSYRTSAIVSLK